MFCKSMIYTCSIKLVLCYQKCQNFIKFLNFINFSVKNFFNWVQICRKKKPLKNRSIYPQILTCKPSLYKKETLHARISKSDHFCERRVPESQAHLKNVPRTWIAFTEHEHHYTCNETNVNDVAVCEFMKNHQILLNNAGGTLNL